jgi:hypothetical protein
MAQNIHMYKTFNATTMSCCELVKNRAGGNQVMMMHNNKRGNVLIQTPNVSIPFGLSEYTPDNGSGPKYSIDISFKGYEGDSKIKKLMEVMRTMDTHLIDMGVLNSVKWFGKTMSKEVICELYRPLVKESKQPEKYAPTLKCKIRTFGDTMRMEAFHKDRTSFDVVKDLQAGSSVKLILEFSPIWFVNKQFGITLNIVQMEVVQLPTGRLTGFAFIDEDGDEDVDEDYV